MKKKKSIPSTFTPKYIDFTAQESQNTYIPHKIKLIYLLKYIQLSSTEPLCMGSSEARSWTEHKFVISFSRNQGSQIYYGLWGHFKLFFSHAQVTTNHILLGTSFLHATGIFHVKVKVRGDV